MADLTFVDDDYLGSAGGEFARGSGSDNASADDENVTVVHWFEKRAELARSG